MNCSALDSRIFRNLFGTEEIREVFSDTSYVQCMIDAETALGRAQSKVGIIPSHVGDAITRSVDITKLEYELSPCSHNRRAAAEFEIALKDWRTKQISLAIQFFLW